MLDMKYVATQFQIFEKAITNGDLTKMVKTNGDLIRMVKTDDDLVEIAMSDDDRPGDDRDSGLATSIARPITKQPPMYKVVLLNDDYTPMDFVVDVLCTFFTMNIEKATQIMLKVHTEGKAVCGVYSRDVAETKAQQVNDYSKEFEQPLLCNVEVDR